MRTNWKLNSLLLILMMYSCPACKNKQEEHGHSEAYRPMNYDTLVQIISPSKQVLSNQATVKLQSGGNGNSLKTQGYIDINPDRNQSVSARYGGRIEKLYVKFSMQYVKQGDKIMDLYSPALRTIQEEHLFLVKSDVDNTLVEKSREKLRLLGITQNQITELEKNGTVAFSISVFSPHTGFVFFNEPTIKQNAPIENPSAMDGMDAAVQSNNSFSSPASQIREGQYVNEGQNLFIINDLQQVWAIVSVPIDQLAEIQKNQLVELSSEDNPSKVLNGKIVQIEQSFEESNQRFARVRIVLPNADKSLKINSLITAHIALAGNGNLQVPTSAVYKTGLNSYVWLKTGTTKSGTGIFQLKKVITSAGSSGMSYINYGLSPDDEIAKQAGLMTDSETLLNEN